jgi:hypothetical protein
VAASSCTSTCVTYVASGTFSTTVVKGTDTFKLAGQKFNIGINNVPTTAKPFKTGTGFDDYDKLNMTGTVNSGLDPTPVELASSAAQIELAIEQSKGLDVFSLDVPVKVLGLTFTILAEINAPVGTITKLSIYPFSKAVTLTTTTTQVVYSYTPAGSSTPESTTLTIASGTLASTCTGTGCPTDLKNPGLPKSGSPPSASLHAGASPDGTPAAVLAAAVAIPMRRQDVPALVNC